MSNSTELTPEQWHTLDELLAKSQVFAAVAAYRALTMATIPAAKDAIGTRFRNRFPDLWSSYRNLSDDD